MRFREPDEGLPQVMVIPMIDIMFFLLVFFYDCDSKYE